MNASHQLAIRLNEVLDSALAEAMGKVEQEIQNSCSTTHSAPQNRHTSIWKTAIDSSPDWIFVKNQKLRYVLANASYAQAIGKSVDEIIGRNDIELGFPKELVLGDAAQGIRGFRQDDLAVLDGKTIYNPYDPATIADGSTRIFETKKVPVRDKSGKIFGCLGIARDITERKAAEESLKQTNERLLQATQLKDEFLASMSHELRTPLNAILGLSEALERELCGPLNQKQTKLIETIRRSGKHLLELINDILDVSKISAGKLTLETTPVAVDYLCKYCISLVKAQADQKQIQIETCIGDRTGLIQADERRMHQVLINLLSNAIKFTPAGGHVQLKVTHETMTPPHNGENEAGDPANLETETKATQADHQSSQWLCFSVVDNGIGIAEADRDRLFKPFIQIDSSLARQHTGTGLGLVIAKQIVELHNGFITLDSEPDKGSCFKVYLPYHSASALPNDGESTEPMAQSPEESAAARILLVEDNEDNILTASTYLTAMGYELTVARSGKEAIATAQANCPDIILMDIQMPGMNGLEATELIRKIPQLCNVPIVALTALTMPGDRDKAIAAGADAYLAKPFELETLTNLINRLVELE